MSKLRVGHYGYNGHNVLSPLKEHDRAELTAVCHIPRDVLAQHWGEEHPGLDAIKQTESLDEMLAECDLIVCCAPVRHEQPDLCFHPV